MSACDVTGPLPRPVLQIHTYLATHGNTKRGRDQAHKDDTGDDGHVNPPRKCPRILNDWTQAQPHIDKSNRWRQRILAIEERFPTTSFPFRLMTTIIGGMSIVSAFTMFCYHVNPDEYDFRSFVETVAYDAMTNTYDRDHSSVPRDGSSLTPPLQLPQLHACPLLSSLVSMLTLTSLCLSNQSRDGQARMRSAAVTVET